MEKDSFLHKRLKSAANPKRKVLVEVPPFPRNLMIELSNACNHACIFCANPKMTRKKRPMDRSLAEKIMRDAFELGSREVGFYTTGEPFVHKSLEEFILFAKQTGYEYTYISTNGALASPDRAKKAIDAGLDSIKFSVNAGSKESYLATHGKDDWDTVLANIKYIAEYRKTLKRPLKLGISFIITDKTRHEVEAFKALFVDLVDDIIFHEADWQQGYMLENKQFVAPDTKSVMTKAPCYMVFNRLHVSCEGLLTACCVDYQNYLATSDLTKVGIKEAWEAPAFVELRKRHLADQLEGTLCWNCLRGSQDPIEPLVPELATYLDFAESSKKNLEKQKTRFPILA